MTSTSDRRWMYNTNIDGHSNPDYVNNLERFLDFAYSNPEVVENKLTMSGNIVLNIKCPCKVCSNKPYRSRETVLSHLLKKGFMPGYYTWTEHGETSVQEVGQTSMPMDCDDEDEAYDCRRMLLDSINGYNPTIQPYQASNTSNTVQDDVPNPKAKKFYKMLQSSEEPLWDGCSNWTTLQAATALLNWKSHCNVPVSTFNFILPIFKSMLPKDNNLPDNFYAIKKSLDQLSMPSDRIHACKNHCMLFYDDADKELTHCRWCKEPRYKSDHQKIPQLVLTYMPIGPRLQQLFMNKKTAKDMTWHHDHKTKEGSMAHPSDGKAWKHFDTVNPFFAEEIRNVRLGLCTDGFSPSNSNSNPYSLWPVFLTIYNLPPWMSSKDSFIQLSLVIPGRKSPGQNLDVFLRPLIDELKDLYDDGIETYDAYRKQNFSMRAILLWTVSDFPAYAMLSGWSTHGILACPCCMGDTKSFRLRAGGKPCWFDCHRRFLPPKHAFRRDKNGFKANSAVTSSFGPPLELTGDEILEQVYNIRTVYEGNPYDPKAPKPPGFGKTHNWVKKSIFWELPYWRLLLIRHNLDVMHIEKNVFENLFHTVMDTPKTKDNLKARLDLSNICNRPELNTFTGNNNKVMKPKASYTLTKSNIKKVCEWLIKVKFPDGYASNIGGCVNVKECSFYSFKSHDCHVFMQRLLPIALKGMVPNPIWDAITELCTFFRVICSKVLHTKDLQELEKSIVVTICKLEKNFPPGFFDSMEHLVIHLAREAILGGPVQYRWMYPYERKLGILKRTIRNKARVVGSIVESYRVDELSKFCSLYFGSTVQTKLNREFRNFAPEISCSSAGDPRLSIFKVPSRRLLGEKFEVLTSAEMHKIHTYILLNCVEVHESILKFDQWIREAEPFIKDEDLVNRRDALFGQWFNTNVMLESHGNNAHLKCLAQYPLTNVYYCKGYLINGYKFHTQTANDGRVTQNSGVCVKGAFYDQHENDYYGLLDEIIEVEYDSHLGRCVVVVFKCTWFDPVQGVKVDHKTGLVEIKHNKRGCTDDPYILASQAQQVYYTPYPYAKDLWAAVKTNSRGVYDLDEDASEVDVDDNNVDVDQFFQENERVICTTSANNDIQPFNLVHGDIEEVDNDLDDDTNDDDVEEDQFEDITSDENDDIELIFEEDESD